MNLLPATSWLQVWFAHPWAFWLFALLPAWGILTFLAVRRRRLAVARLGSLPALAALTVDRPYLRQLRVLSSLSAFVFLVVGMAGPRWGRDWEQTAPVRDLVVLLDVSRTMLAESPRRLDRAREALLDLSRIVAQRGGYRLGLVVFAARAEVVCPLTRDYDHFRDALDNLDVVLTRATLRPSRDGPRSGTRMGAGLQAAARLHDPRFHGFQDILMISDGDDPLRDEEWRVGVQKCLAQKIPAHTVGVGDPDRGIPIPVGIGDSREDFLRNGENRPILTQLDETPLREIAFGTGGTYTLAGTKALPLEEWFRTRIESRPAREEDDESLPTYRLRSAWFFAAAFLMLTLEMTLGLQGRHQLRTQATGVSIWRLRFGLAKAVKT